MRKIYIYGRNLVIVDRIEPLARAANLDHFLVRYKQDFAWRTN